MIFPLAIFALAASIVISFFFIIAAERRRRGVPLFTIDEESSVAMACMDQLYVAPAPVKEMKIHVA